MPSVNNVAERPLLVVPISLSWIGVTTCGMIGSTALMSRKVVGKFFELVTMRKFLKSLPMVYARLFGAMANNGTPYQNLTLDIVSLISGLVCYYRPRLMPGYNVRGKCWIITRSAVSSPRTMPG
jgi:hypothetical protein